MGRWILNWILKRRFKQVQIQYQKEEAFRMAMKEGPLLLLPNHKDVFDGPLLWQYVYPVHFIAKESLRNTWLGKLLSWGGTFYLPADAHFKEQIKKRLRQKIPIGLFLEGKRMPEGLMAEAKTGALKAILECLKEEGLLERARWVPVGISYEKEKASIAVGSPQEFYHMVPGTMWQFAQKALGNAYNLTKNLHRVPGTLCHLFYSAVGRHPNETALFYRGEKTTWAELKAKVEAVSKTLWQKGLRPGDRVAIYAETCPEWEILDLAIILFGGVTVGIHPHLSREEAQKIISQTNATLIDLKEIPKLIELAPEKIPEWERACANVKPDNLLTLVYTAGTTDQPKGIPLTHKNIVSIITAIPTEGKKITGTLFVYLPLSHILQRVALYRHFVGPTIAAFGSIQTFAQDLKLAKPTTMAVVPEVLYRIRERVLKKLSVKPAWQQRLFFWCLNIGLKRTGYFEKGEPTPLSLNFLYGLAYYLALKRVYHFFGGRLKYIGCGGARLPLDLAKFFWACNVKIFEGYGMSETSAPAAINTPQVFRLGTVGKPFPGVQICIANDGEILVKSPGLNSEQKAEWFHTGDLGRFDSDGFLIITGRKKERIVLRSGEKVHPQVIEERLQEHPWIERAVIFGEDRPYLVGLFTLNAIGRKQSRPLIEKTFEKHIEKINSTLAKFEQIHYFAIVEKETIGLKFNRSGFYKKHAQLLEKLYTPSP